MTLLGDTVIAPLIIIVSSQVHIQFHKLTCAITKISVPLCRLKLMCTIISSYVQVCYMLLEPEHAHTLLQAGMYKKGTAQNCVLTDHPPLR